MNSKQPLLWLTEADVVSLVTLNDAIDALEQTLAMLGSGTALNVPKALGTFADGSSMHSLGGAAPEAGYAAFKNWVFTKRGASALMVVFDSNDGSAAAVIEAAALGQLRTSAISGVATRWLAAQDADVLAVVGTGSQALTQAIAVALVRKLRRIQVFGRDAERRADFIKRLAPAVNCKVVGSGSLEETTREAGIVTLITRAREPFINAALLAPGAHINAVGAILPAAAEFGQDVFDRCDRLVVDDLEAVKRGSREFIERFGGTDDRGWAAVEPLGRVVAQRASRQPGTDLTLFKSMGMGISDLAIAMLALKRARASGSLHAIAQPLRGTLRWQLMA